MRVGDLFKFIQLRHSIYTAKQAGLPKPWTNDPILQQYRFCNVYRELDTQTIWLNEQWRSSNENDPDFWFAALVFRFVNWHETAEELGYPIPWDPARFTAVLNKRKEQRKKVYSGAYMISTHGVKEPKSSYLAKSLTKIYKARRRIRYKKEEPLADFHTRLMNCFDVGSFLAAQVIADAKYVGDMMLAPDWETFAASGPGSRRGLNRVLEVRLNYPWTEEAWRAYVSDLHKEISLRITRENMWPLHAQDLQNCLCEFDKYERVRLGEGRPKQLYKGDK